ncbi:transposase [Streptomyces sp. NPDC003480]
MIRRHEPSEAEGEFVRPPPASSSRGRKRLDDRRVLDGIVWNFRTGTAWRDVPERYRPWATLYTRLRRWAAGGTFERMLMAAQARGRTRSATSTGWCRSTPPSSAPTSTRPGPEKGASQPRPRTLPVIRTRGPGAARPHKGSWCRGLSGAPPRYGAHLGLSTPVPHNSSIR